MLDRATKRTRVAIVFPADPRELGRSRVERSRLSQIAEAFVQHNVEIVSAPFSDEFASEVEALLSTVDGALVWFNPVEAGRNRSVLNAVLRSVASKGVLVSAHPDAIDKMGTKEVLYRTRGMAWGCDTRRYGSLHALRSELPETLKSGPRVLKQLRGQSGDGVWKVKATSNQLLRVRHAKRDCVEQQMTFDEFVDLCSPYFSAAGAMIDQSFQTRSDGMIRCYVVEAQVKGFGVQAVNALYPAAPGMSESDAPQPGPRLYFPSTRPDLQRLKQRLKGAWVPEMCRILGMCVADLPILWDADFLYGPKDKDGADTYVLCEINVSSVFPFPPSALEPLIIQTLQRIGQEPLRCE